ncbi:MAG: DUF2282 domain-containing protein [Alphaproteobacteria bacterium]|nr:DUF2282 domain-containing protein [Alphaproteobacteria bacterium]
MNKKLLAAAVMAALVSGTAAQAADKPEREKCYGVAKAGKNDCAAKDGSSSCAGQSKKDHDANNWIYVPKGLCDKLAGGVKA